MSKIEFQDLSAIGTSYFFRATLKLNPNKCGQVRRNIYHRHFEEFHTAELQVLCRILEKEWTDHLL